jgi:hypothetical protein
MPKMFANDTEAMPDDKRDAYRKELDEIYREAGLTSMGGFRYTDIVNALKKLGYTNHGKQEKIIKDGVAEGIIRREDNGRYYYNGNSQQSKAEEQQMPFEPTDEEAPY